MAGSEYWFSLIAIVFFSQAAGGIFQSEVKAITIRFSFIHIIHVFPFLPCEDVRVTLPRDVYHHEKALNALK